jgi:hypothetical protein
MIENFKGKLKYIKENFGLDDDVISKIGEIGEIVNTTKYNVWLAKEIKKDLSLIEDLNNFQLVIDWAKCTKADIFNFSMSEAMIAQKEWHDSKFSNVEITKIDIPNIDQNRIVYRCSDQKHFFYLLNHNELEYEGKIMKHCVDSYKEIVRKQDAFIVSLRDLNNEPHVTIEVNRVRKQTVQIRGKANCDPSKKYKTMIKEFALYATGYENFKQDKEILDLLNLDLF